MRVKDNIEFYIESARERRVLKGWGLIRGYDSYKTEAFLEKISHGRSEVFQVKMRPRKDVATAFGSDQYLFSGFFRMLRFKERDTINLILRNGIYVGKRELKWS